MFVDKSSYSVKATNLLKNKLRTTTVFLQTFESSFPEKSASTSICYLLIGVGALIVILLSILVLQSFKKSKSSRRVTVKYDKEEQIDDKIFDKNFQRNETLSQSCSSTEKYHYCDLIDTEYEKRDSTYVTNKDKLPLVLMNRKSILFP